MSLIHSATCLMIICDRSGIIDGRSVPPIAVAVSLMTLKGRQMIRKGRQDECTICEPCLNELKISMKTVRERIDEIKTYVVDFAKGRIPGCVGITRASVDAYIPIVMPVREHFLVSYIIILASGSSLLI